MSAGRGSINVTPLIDVLLVLLIIFLVMMPLMAKVETVDLPPRSEDQADAPPVILELKADLTIAIDEGPPQPSSDLSQIRSRLTHGKHVFVDAESSVPWDEVVGLIDRVRGLAPSYDAVQVAVRIRQAAE